MKRILFVDDEPKVLEGLQRMLRPQRKQWEMVFANSGVEALALLEASRFDVVVSDVRMPEMDGAQLLQRVQERYPGMIRVVLSGYFEREAALKAAGVAHQYLAKPCDPETLREAIERLCRSTAILTDEATRSVVGAIGSLPSLPRSCAELMEALERPDAQIEEIGRIIEQDVGMTAKVLQLVNSSLFGLLCEITCVHRAVDYIGLETLRQLVLSVEIFRTFEPERPIAGFSLEDFQSHARLAAKIAARLSASRDTISPSVVAALLHDTGKLVLAARLPQQFERALQVSATQGRLLHIVEEELMGTSHAEIGAYLLSLWGLPGVIVDAVSRHHHPTAAATGGGLDVLGVTHIADALAYELATGGRAGPGTTDGLLNVEYVTALGVAGQLPGWRLMAEQIANPAGVVPCAE